MANGRSRLDTRFAGDAAQSRSSRAASASRSAPPRRCALGLVTFAPDELDWEDELRLALEERAACRPTRSPASRRACASAAPETMETKIFGRLSAWQNWIFNRPNAVGEKGALKVFGSGSKAQFDWERV